MNYNVFFSPTGGTEKVVEYIGEKFNIGKKIDISFEISDFVMAKDDFCIVGVPSFGGRVPAVAAERLRRLKGSRTPALIVVAYGNRDYEDALKELKDVLEAQGFVCVGAAAIITQHSIAPEIGAGRPNREDYLMIDKFVDGVKARLKAEPCSVSVPGNSPYKELHSSPMHMQVADSCIKCGICAKNCPVNAIPLENPQATDYEKCISCMRCIGICPLKARNGDEVKIGQITAKLKAICQPDKKPEFF